MKKDPILDKLDEQQREAASSLFAPLCIVAGAGTGKTRTVTHRIAYAVNSGQIDPSKILPLTHSQKAAGEMRHRLTKLGVSEVSARTFHAAALRQLKHFWTYTNRDHPLVILDNRYPVVRKAMEKTFKNDITAEQVFDVANEIGWAKSQILLPRSYAKKAKLDGRDPGFDLEQVAEIYKTYEALKNKDGKIDFEDLLGVLANLINQEKDVADDIRKTYNSFVVDEYQDVDPLQIALLDAWLGDGEDICVVGDPRQSIYAFKGAVPEVFEQFKSKFPQAKEVALVRDYRSTKQIVESANKLMGQGGESLIGQLGDGPIPQVRDFSGEQEEERFLVETIKDIQEKGTPLSEIALLYRFNSQSARLEAALMKAGIPYSVADDEKFFERAEIKAVLSRLWELGKRNPDGIGVELLGEALMDMGFDRLNPPAGAGAARARFEAMAALEDMVGDLPSVETLGVRYLVNELAHRASESHQVTPNGVVLSTLHKAKGLEWEAVFMVNVTEGSLPSAYATTETMIAEEKRLAYVGVTRAKRILYLTYSLTNSKNWRMRPSRFLKSFNKEVVSVKTESGVAGRKSKAKSKPKATLHLSCKECSTPIEGGLRSVGLCTACMPADVAQRAETLTNWRRAKAREKKIPTVELLEDGTLWKIALRNPTKLSELIEIEEFNDSNACGYGREMLEKLRSKK